MTKPSTKRIIAVDLDDVLSSQVDAMINFLAAAHDVHLNADDFKAPGNYWSYFENMPGIDPEKREQWFNEFLDAKTPYTQTISAEVVESLQRLKGMGYTLEIVTSRGKDWQKGTEEWLEKHQPNVFNNIHFVELWGTKSKKATKAEICQQIGAGYLIDDNVEHCNLAAESGVTALLFGEFGWNLYHEVHPKVQRVKDWAEVVEFFSEAG